MTNPYEPSTTQPPAPEQSASDSTVKKPMTAQDWFGVTVRIFALYSIFIGFEYLLSFIAVRAGWNSIGVGESYLMYMLGHAAFGLILLSNASILTEFTFRARRDDNDD